VKVAVIGLGLIGGSLLRALAAAGHTVVGYDTDPATRAMARTAAAQVPSRARWLVAKTIRDAIDGTGLAVVATPLPAVPAVLSEIAGAGYAGLVTDAVSVKQPVRELAAHHLRWADQDGQGPKLAGYVGGHPMAGRETAGFTSADPELFTGCAWVLCLDPETSLPDWLTVAKLLTPLGVRVVPATAEAHDRAVAGVSHVPHLLASALATAVDDPLAATLAAGSFRDGTRVAGSPTALIAAMCGGNAGPVLDALDTLQARLDAARRALRSDDPVAAMRAWAEPGNTARAGWPRGWGEPSILRAEPKELLALGEAGGWITAVAPDRRTVTAVRPAA
jgi:prephenate dehydrogenase